MKYFVDGFTYGGNPSHKGGGFTIVDENNKLVIRQEVLKPNFTNNEAEVLGVHHAAKIAAIGDQIITDSKNTIWWCRSGKPKARPDLSPICKEAKRLIFEKYLQLDWQPREVNLAGIYNEFGEAGTPEASAERIDKILREDKAKSIGTWKGRPVEELSREELLEIIKYIGEENYRLNQLIWNK